MRLGAINGHGQFIDVIIAEKFKLFLVKINTLAMYNVGEDLIRTSPVIDG